MSETTGQKPIDPNDPEFGVKIGDIFTFGDDPARWRIVSIMRGEDGKIIRAECKLVVDNDI